MRHIYLLVVGELLADLAGVQSVQAAAAFGRPGAVLRLKAVVDEAPLDACRRERETLDSACSSVDSQLHGA